MKSIKEELLKAAEHLGIQQDKEEADQQVINSKVELVNAKHTINLSMSSYLALLDYQSVEEIKAQIEHDAQKEITKVQYEQVPVSSAPGYVEDEKVFVEIYRVEGTESDLEKLEEYMSSNGMAWKVIEE